MILKLILDEEGVSKPSKNILNYVFMRVLVPCVSIVFYIVEDMISRTSFD